MEPRPELVGRGDSQGYTLEQVVDMWQCWMLCRTDLWGDGQGRLEVGLESSRGGQPVEGHWV